MWNKIFLYTFAGVVTLVLSYVGASYFFSLLYNSNSEVVVETLEVSTTTTTITNTSSGVSEESILTTSTEYVGSVSTSTNIVLPTSILHDVPFTSSGTFW
jgi:CHASE3 domain sensor protein